MSLDLARGRPANPARIPDAAARAYLHVIASEPDIVRHAFEKRRRD